MPKGKVYLWNGKPVSRSTYYRKVKNGNKAAHSLAATRKRLVRETSLHEVEIERVDAFLRATGPMARGPDNEDVTITIPRRWLKAVSAVLPKVA